MAEMSPELFAELETLEQKHAEHPQGRYFVPLANAYRKAGRVEQAETLIRDGLRHHPDYLSAHIVLGRCLRDRGATDEAEATFRRVLDTDSQNLVALRSLGELAAASGRTGEAREWLERLVAVDPLNDEARLLLADLDEAEAGGDEVEVAAGDGYGLPAEMVDGEGHEGEAEATLRAADSGDEVEAHASLLEDDLSLDAGPGEAAEAAPPSGLDTFEPLELDGDEPIELEGDLEVMHERADEETEVPVEAEDFGLVTFDGPIETDDLSLSGGAPPGQEPGSFEEAGQEVDAGAWDESLDLDIDLGGAADPSQDEAAAGETGDTELATRTMADLYARQGFHDRAAEVYRRLLREGGEDPELRQRLEECEAALAGAGTENADADADPFADSFAEGFVTPGAGDEGDAGGGGADDEEADDPHELDIDALERAFGEPDEGSAVPELEEASAQTMAGSPSDAPASETIGAYLSRLARWSPEEIEADGRQEEEGESAASVPVPDITGAVDPEAEGSQEEVDPDDEPAPWDITPEPAEAVREDEVDDGLLPWEEPAEEEPAAGEGAPDLEPWDEPLGVDTEAADASAAGPDGDPGHEAPLRDGPAHEEPTGEAEEAFERYFAEDEPEPEPEEAATPVDEGADSGRAEGDVETDDDDLESFQAWLQSLKT